MLGTASTTTFPGAGLLLLDGPGDCKWVAGKVHKVLFKHTGVAFEFGIGGPESGVVGHHAEKVGLLFGGAVVGDFVFENGTSVGDEGFDDVYSVVIGLVSCYIINVADIHRPFFNLKARSRLDQVLFLYSNIGIRNTNSWISSILRSPRPCKNVSIQTLHQFRP